MISLKKVTKKLIAGFSFSTYVAMANVGVDNISFCEAGSWSAGEGEYSKFYVAL